MTPIRPPAKSPFAHHRVRLRDALDRLASAGSSETVRASASRELVEACGFTRAMMSAVLGSRWVPLHLYTRGEIYPEPAPLRAFVDGDADIPLGNLLAETDMVRRRTAVLVDASLIDTRAFKPIVRLSGSPAYVAAPIIVDGRTIGFMHADRVGQQRHVDDDDRRYLQAFCAELAIVYQRAIWAERIAERARRAVTELERAQQSLELIDSPAADFPITRTRQLSVAANTEDAVRIYSLRLTTREWEVLDHVAAGATNWIIAPRLSVSENTVKTHMRNVLRKLRVTTRGAAVARYLEMSQGPR
jgi:DNA-binding CsgD family transcriptional regulator